MNFETYQQRVLETAVYPNLGENFIYPLLGLNGEVGEVTEIVKKLYRDDNGQLKIQHREKLKKELGDVLWYVAQLSTELGLNLDNIAQLNLEKLKSRKERGVLQGSGDDR